MDKGNRTGRCRFAAAPLLLGLMLASTPVFARHGGRGPDAAERGKRIAARLNLSADQKKQLDEHRARRRKTMEPLRKELREKRAELDKELARAETRTDVVDRLSADIKALSAKMIDARIEGRLALQRILTPGQREELRKMREAHRKKAGKRGGRPRGRR